MNTNFAFQISQEDLQLADDDQALNPGIEQPEAEVQVSLIYIHRKIYSEWNLRI